MLFVQLVLPVAVVVVVFLWIACFGTMASGKEPPRGLESVTIAAMAVMTLVALAEIGVLAVYGHF